MTVAKPVKLQKVADFESLVRKHFPHVDGWKVYPNNSQPSANYLVDGGIDIEATRKYIGKGKESDVIADWSIDCAPGGSGRTIEEAIEDWKARILHGIANYYEPKYEFDFEAIRKAKAGGEKTLRKLTPPGEFYRWNLYLLRMELGKDIPIPTDPYADLRKD
jgi:hypothetical protein